MGAGRTRFYFSYGGGAASVRKKQGVAPWGNEMQPWGLSPNERSNGLSLRESPWDPALTYRALTDSTAVGFLTDPQGL